MWDEAASTLAVDRGWTTILLSCPNKAEAKATAKSEIEARGISNVNVLIVPEPFTGALVMRASKLKHIDPRWDDVEDHLNNHAPVALLIIDETTDDSTSIIDEAFLAMAERGINVSVGYSVDAASNEGLIRVEKV